jgi:predicted CXXCH cytochrome family protein
MEWFLCALLVVFGLALAVPPPGRRRLWFWAPPLAVAAISAAGALAWSARHTVARGDALFVQTKLPHQGRPADGYVSSDRCAACHPDQYSTWHHTFHRTMTQIVRPDNARGAFDKVSLELEGETFRLERRGDEFWAELPGSWLSMSPRRPIPGVTPRVSRRLGLMTGSHHMQIYWVSADTNQPTNLQIPFPFAYLFDDHRWVPLNDTFLRDPNAHSGQGLWNMNCIDCHATAGQSKPDRQAGTLDTRVGELGIACEACHGPGDAHVRANESPLRRYSLHGRGRGDSTIVNPARLSSQAASQVCGRCHGIAWILDSADFRANGSRFRPGMELKSVAPVIQPTRPAEMPAELVKALRGIPSFLSDRYWPDGMVRVSGRDFNGLIESPCYKKGSLSCLSCHSMHQSDPVNQISAGMEGNGACLQCHKQFRASASLAAHTHHPADSTGSVCYDCHMQRTTYGLLKAIRNHYIENPGAAVSAGTGRPNGCNLCHLDRTLAWTDQHLVSWFGSKPALLSQEEQTVAASVLWALRGDAGQRALAAWHMGWGTALKTSGDKWEAPYLAQLLEDPYAAVRYIASRSLKSLPGFRDFNADFEAKTASRPLERDRALARWRLGGLPAGGAPELLTGADGAPQTARMAELLRQRDDTSMDLQE